MYDKKQSCFYCEKEFAKIARHYQQVHGDEEEVKHAIQYPANDERRKLQFEKLCRMGNYNHNMKVIEEGKGEIKVVRRPKAEESANPNDYLPCKYCHGFFLGCELWRHAPKCPLRCEEDNHSSRSMQYEGKLLIAGGKFPDGSSKLLSEKVLATMAHDSISIAVKSDKTILTLGSEMLEKKGADKPNEISQK